MLVTFNEHLVSGFSSYNIFFSFRSIQRKYTTGRPDQKDLNENLAAAQGLSHMIIECQHLFQVRIKLSGGVISPHSEALK